MISNSNINKISCALLGLAALIQIQVAKAVPTPVSWNSWNFEYEVDGNFDGLSLRNVSYQGTTLIKKISLPVMRVFYDNNICGPYADRLGGQLSPVDWAGGATIAQRQFSLDGKQWYEIGIRDQIGNYDIYQVYYLSSDGVIDAHIFSKGLQCVINHIHYPNWRIDFDIDGPANDVIEHMVGNAYQRDGIEFDLNANQAVNHNWRIRDTVSNIHVDMLPGFPGFTIPNGSTTIPVSDFSNGTVFGRLYKITEDTGWGVGPNVQVPYLNSESIDNQDLVAWYESYLPHSAQEGSAVWHSTGLRLVSSMSNTLNPPLPDVVVTSVTYNNGIFTSTVKNQGTAATPANVDVGVGYSVDGQYKTWGSIVGPLAAGATATITTQGGAYLIPNAGDHSITAFVDDINRFPESIESNNKLSANSNVAASMKSDIVVTSISYTNGIFTSVVKNQGMVETPAGVWIGVGYYVDNVYKTWGAAKGPLPPGASTTITTWGAPYVISSGLHTFSAHADDINRFEEMDDTNNKASQSITIP